VFPLSPIPIEAVSKVNSHLKPQSNVLKTLKKAPLQRIIKMILSRFQNFELWALNFELLLIQPRQASFFLEISDSFAEKSAILIGFT
jgi:hypothetical protein